MLRRLIPLLLLVAALAGCAGVSERGERAALMLLDAWGDTTAMRGVDTLYHSMLDSLSMPGAAGQMQQAFVSHAVGNDSVHAVAQVIAMSPDEFAEEYARPLVDGLLDGSLDATQATDRLMLLNWAALIMGKTSHAEHLNATIDAVANDLADDKLMLLYSRAATPAALAKMMRTEREQSGADTARISKRVALLRKCYNDKQMAEFEAEYGQ